jgi:hypothetical protein
MHHHVAVAALPVYETRKMIPVLFLALGKILKKLKKNKIIYYFIIFIEISFT